MSSFMVFLIICGIFSIIFYTLSAIKAVRDRQALKAKLEAKRNGTWQPPNQAKYKSLIHTVIIYHDNGREERIKHSQPRFRGSVVYTKDGVKIRGRLSVYTMTPESTPVFPHTSTSQLMVGTAVDAQDSSISLHAAQQKDTTMRFSWTKVPSLLLTVAEEENDPMPPVHAPAIVLGASCSDTSEGLDRFL